MSLDTPKPQNRVSNRNRRLWQRVTEIQKYLSLCPVLLSVDAGVVDRFADRSGADSPFYIRRHRFCGKGESRPSASFVQRPPVKPPAPARAERSREGTLGLIRWLYRPLPKKSLPNMHKTAPYRPLLKKRLPNKCKVVTAKVLRNFGRSYNNSGKQRSPP